MKKLILKILITGLFCIPLISNAQGLGGNGRIEEDFKFLPIPYVNYNRSIGFQLGAIPMAQFNPVCKDTLSPSSVAGLFGMYSTNKTYFFMAFARTYFDKDNWRFTAAGGTGNVNFQFYLGAIDTWIPYSTGMDIIFVEAQRRVYKKIYLGLSYVYIKFDTETEITEDVYTTTLNGLGLKYTMDYRKNVYYPTEDYFNNLKFLAYPEFMGNEDVSSKIQIDHNHFFPVRCGQDVIAARAYVGLGLGDLTFNQQFIVGTRDDIRGYTQGEYRGNYMAAIQGEYRWNLDESKFGFVGFFGLASVFESFNEDQNGQILPGAGVGFRYTVSEETNMNVGMDVAVGKNDWGLYFRLGESFSN